MILALLIAINLPSSIKSFRRAHLVSECVCVHLFIYRLAGNSLEMQITFEMSNASVDFCSQWMSGIVKWLYARSIFNSEMCNLMNSLYQNPRSGTEFNMSVTVIYNKFDAITLAQIVGQNRAAEMIESESKVHTIRCWDSNSFSIFAYECKEIII